MRDFDAEIREAEERVAALKEERDIALNGASALGFKPRDELFFITCKGKIERCASYDGENPIRSVILQGNAFHTREEAERERIRREIAAELKYLSEKSGEKWRKWDRENRHYFIEYDFGFEDLSVWSQGHGISSEIYFATEKDARDAIKKVGKRRIIKYYFGVGVTK